MVYSGWRFILFLVYGHMTSNFICLAFSTFSSSSLENVTIFLSSEKTVFHPGTTSLSLRNFASVGDISKQQPSQDIPLTNQV